MKNKSIRPFNKLALISTPWPLYSRPSIQLGTLKAYLKARTPDLEVDVFHFYLSLAEAIGYRLYHENMESKRCSTIHTGPIFSPLRFIAPYRL